MKGLRILNLIIVSLFAFALFYGCAEEINEAKLEESGEIDSKIDDHASDASAHHPRYTDEEAVTAINADPEHGSTANHNYTTDASLLVSGTLSTERIPNLDASIITSGTFSEDRLPSSTITTSSNTHAEIFCSDGPCVKVCSVHGLSDISQTGGPETLMPGMSVTMEVDTDEAIVEMDFSCGFYLNNVALGYVTFRPVINGVTKGLFPHRAIVSESTPADFHWSGILTNGIYEFSVWWNTNDAGLTADVRSNSWGMWEKRVLTVKIYKR